MASWTTQDAEASRQKVAAGTALTADPDADRWAMIRAFAVTLADFWATHKYDFSKFWIELDADARRNLLLTVSPAMPKSVDDPRSTAGEAVPIAPLVPELNLADLTASARAMLALFGQRALGVDALWDLQTADIVYAQKVMDLPAATQFLARDARRRAEGEWLPVDSGAGPPDPNLQLFDAHFVRGMLEREMFLSSTLASVADEYRREVLKDTDVCVASAPAWAPPKLRTAKAADLADAWDAYQRAAGLKGADAAESADAPVDSPPPSPTKAKRKKKKKKKGAKATS